MEETKMKNYKIMRAAFLKLTLIMAMGLWGATAFSQPYPNRSIKFVVPFPPGSATDSSARYFGKKLSEMISQPVVIENKPGGNSFIAIQQVMNAPADGYTVFIGSNSPMAVNTAVFKSLPYKFHTYEPNPFILEISIIWMVHLGVKRSIIIHQPDAPTACVARKPTTTAAATRQSSPMMKSYQKKRKPPTDLMSREESLLGCLKVGSLNVRTFSPRDLRAFNTVISAIQIRITVGIIPSNERSECGQIAPAPSEPQ